MVEILKIINMMLLSKLDFRQKTCSALFGVPTKQGTMLQESLCDSLFSRAQVWRGLQTWRS